MLLTNEKKKIFIKYLQDNIYSTGLIIEQLKPESLIKKQQLKVLGYKIVLDDLSSYESEIISE